MKKLVLLFFVFFASNIYAQELMEVSLEKCVDGDTAYFMYEDQVFKSRFLAVDTPETIHPSKGSESGGKEASSYTCERLKNADKIEISYDEHSNKYDKYDRHLVWVFVDDKLLQKELVEKGLATVAYIYGNYEYTNLLCDTQKKSIESRVGIWQDRTREIGYCDTLKNTSIKVVKESNEKDKIISYILAGKYDKAIENILPYVSFLPIVIILLIVYIIIFVKKQRKHVNKTLKKCQKWKLKIRNK